MKTFPRIYQFFNGDHNQFVLLLRKGLYAYEYMDSWERFNETSLPPKKSFYSELNLEDISDKDYLHAQKAWDAFEIRSLDEYHDLYVQTDTSLQMFMTNLEINALTYMDLILLISYLHLD